MGMSSEKSEKSSVLSVYIAAMGLSQYLGRNLVLYYILKINRSKGLKHMIPYKNVVI